jgi:two-component system chemotaxis sensor kinase CheA
VAEHLNSIAAQLAAMEKEADGMQRLAAASLRTLAPADRFLRVNGYLDATARKLHSLSSQTRVVRRLQERNSWTLRHLGKQLQEDVWQARMAPAEGLLEGYRKMVRDLARDEAKEIEFRATSTGVHADRRVLEALKDPLMHILRNAISHGIERPHERTAKGKAPAGVLTLHIGSEGQQLTITVEDDGRGVDLPRVAEEAVRRGILSSTDSAPWESRELERLLFRPGFSTSRSVTDISGRGMGLSVVYEAIRRLQGNVEFEPMHGCGTRIRLSAPLSISTHRLLVAGCSHQTFAVPMHGIERLHRINVKKIETLEGKPVIILDGQPTPVFSLHHLLNLDEASASARTDVLQLMVLRSGGRRTAVTVDAFFWETDAVIQDLGPAGAPDGKISGGILLADGSVAFVLNLTELLKTSAHLEAPAFLKPTEPAPVAASILVVDDSLTTRTLEKSILEAHGYRVRIAVDGVEALDQLSLERADLVIADIEMPRLDGFGLLEAMKKDSRLDSIPVIMVTSLERAEDQQRGLTLGAGAYIVKRKFDQGELLAAIRQIL